MPESTSPFASSSLAALRLLVGYALHAAETAAGRPTLLAHAGATAARPCQRVFAVTAACCTDRAMAGVLDGLLAATLGDTARPYANASAAKVARFWRERGHALEGPALGAILWQVARRHESGFRALEGEIVRACPPERLLSRDQRAVGLLGPQDGSNGSHPPPSAPPTGQASRRSR
jgi:hypothetical protein